MCSPPKNFTFGQVSLQQLIPDALFSNESVIFSVAVFLQDDFQMEVTHVARIPQSLPLLSPHTQ